MNKALPDVAQALLTREMAPLNWVGMEGITQPLMLSTDSRINVIASADIGVDLPASEESVRGIHMSRLYKLLATLEEKALSSGDLQRVLQQSIDSHQDCHSGAAQLMLNFDLALSRQALLTQGSGWQRYPVSLRADLNSSSGLSLKLEVQVQYSSTCPCSAALSREALVEAFLEGRADQAHVSVAEVSDWLRQYGSIATPHSQRSVASVQVELAVSDCLLLNSIEALISQIEQALQTPLQTLVKREDEQAFALRNGANLMYVEDASRRLLSALQTYAGLTIKVRHAESLHAHDAVARASLQR